MAEFFAQLRRSGVLMRLRFSEIDPGQVTGYSVTLADHTTRDGTRRTPTAARPAPRYGRIPATRQMVTGCQR